MPAAIDFSGSVANTINSVKAAGASSKAQGKILADTCGLIDELQVGIVKLEEAVAKSADIEDVSKQARAYRDSVIPAMAEVRKAADSLEMIVDADLWPLPTYAEMLFLR
jgi:glutamine synthetase